MNLYYLWLPGVNTNLYYIWLPDLRIDLVIDLTSIFRPKALLFFSMTHKLLKDIVYENSFWCIFGSDGANFIEKAYIPGILK